MKNRQFAARYGLTQPPGITDEQFDEWLNSMRGNVRFIQQARNVGLSVPFGIPVHQLRKTIFDRQRQMLKEKGITCNAKVSYRDWKVQIWGIIVNEKEFKITIKYWILEPWTNSTNQGRANFTSAEKMLKGG